jgi:hypothetical protein
MSAERRIEKHLDFAMSRAVWYAALENIALLDNYTECPTRYRTRHFFNNSNTNEDIATKF